MNEFLDALLQNQSDFLDYLCDNEAVYFASMGQVKRTSYAYYLRHDPIPHYHDLNRAMHLRDDGRGAEEVADEVVHFFQNLNRPIVADIDAVAEAQGIGSALRRRGVLPLVGDMLLMGYKASTPPALPETAFRIERLTKNSPSAEDWIALVASDSEPDTYTLWEQVARTEMASELTRAYLASQGEAPIGACSLASFEGWGRIDSVFTHPEYRRHGVATALVNLALRDSLNAGNSFTYLFTEADGAGESVYRKQGFDVVARNPLRRHKGD